MYKYIDDKIRFVYTQESEVVKDDCHCLSSYTYNNVTWHLSKDHVLYDYYFKCVCGYWAMLSVLSEKYHLCSICKRYFYLSKPWIKELPFGPND